MILLDAPKVYVVVEEYTPAEDEDGEGRYVFYIAANREVAEYLKAKAEEQFAGSSSSFYITEKDLEYDPDRRRLIDDYVEGRTDNHPDQLQMVTLQRRLRI